MNILARHLIKAGVITAGNPGSKAARLAFQELAQKIITNPSATFNHVLKQGGVNVKGFLGEVNGQKVIIYLSKGSVGNKIKAGDIVTAIVPTPQQLKNIGL